MTNDCKYNDDPMRHADDDEFWEQVLRSIRNTEPFRPLTMAESIAELDSIPVVAPMSPIEARAIADRVLAGVGRPEPPRERMRDSRAREAAPIIPPAGLPSRPIPVTAPPRPRLFQPQLYISIFQSAALAALLCLGVIYLQRLPKSVKVAEEKPIPKATHPDLPAFAPNESNVDREIETAESRFQKLSERLAAMEKRFGLQRATNAEPVFRSQQLDRDEIPEVVPASSDWSPDPDQERPPLITSPAHRRNIPNKRIGQPVYAPDTKKAVEIDGTEELGTEVPPLPDR